MKRFCPLFILICIFQVSFGQSKKTFYIGHSLSDQIPDMVKSLADDHPEVTFDWAYQTIPGAPLRWQWERKEADDYLSNPPHIYPFYDNNGGLPSGTFDAMVLTEAVPRYGELIEETYQYADSFFAYANTFNPGIQVYLYEDWHCLLSGTPTGCDYDVDSNPWRQRIEDDLSMWESVVDTLNARYNPANPICLIPAAQGLAEVYDSITAGNMPGLTDITDLFSDRIHLNDIGKYFVACVHFSTLFEVSPVGLTHQLQHWWGGDFEAPSPELALKFQQIAWSIANSYSGSCLSSTTNVEQIQPSEQEVILNNYPNPFRYSTAIQFVIPISGHVQISLIDLFGKKRRILLDQQMPKGQHTIQLKREGLESGTYLYQLKVGNRFLTKKMMVIN